MTTLGLGVGVRGRVLGLGLAAARLDDAWHVVVGRGAAGLHVEQGALHLRRVKARVRVRARARGRG